jgi:hypothetical protein
MKYIGTKVNHRIFQGIILISILFFSSIVIEFVYAQEELIDDDNYNYRELEVIWEARYEGSTSDYGCSFIQTSDGGYIILGTTAIYGVQRDIFLLKLNTEGEEEWKKTFGGNDFEHGRFICMSKEGDLIFVGTTSEYDGISGYIWIIKTDSKGNEIWNRTLNTFFNDIFFFEQTPDGGFIIGGENELAHGVNVIKIDSNGNKQWDKNLKLYGGRYYNDMAQTSSDDFIIMSHFYSDMLYTNLSLIKLDINGNIHWNKTYGGHGYDMGNSIQVTPDGGYIITGKYYDTNKLTEVWLLKIDKDGNILWEKTYGGEKEDIGELLLQTKDGGYVILGTTNSYGTSFEGTSWVDLWFIKVNEIGEEQWNYNYGGRHTELPYNILETVDNGFLLITRTNSNSNPNRDIWIIKTDLDGKMEWERIVGGEEYYDYIDCQRASDSAYLLLINTIEYSTQDRDFIFIKFYKEIANKSTNDDNDKNDDNIILMESSYICIAAIISLIIIGGLIYLSIFISRKRDT